MLNTEVGRNLERAPIKLKVPAMNIKVFSVTKNSDCKELQTEILMLRQRLTEMQDQHNLRLRDLARRVSHEINTPLQTILLSLESLSEATNKERLTFIEQVRRQLDRVAAVMYELEQLYQQHPMTNQTYAGQEGEYHGPSTRHNS